MKKMRTQVRNIHLNLIAMRVGFAFNMNASLNKLAENVDRLELNWGKTQNNYAGYEMARNAVYNNI